MCRISNLLVFIALTVCAFAQQGTPQTQSSSAPHSKQTQPAPQAPPASHGPARIVTRTRLVSIFSGMENQLFSGVQKKDKAAITQLTEDDFSIWMPTETGDPLPLDDWLQSIATDYNLKSFRISQMAAHDLGEFVLVKFVVSEKAEMQSKDASGEYFVVDAWKKEGDTWKLSDRYMSKFLTVPAAKTPVKPTGKD